MFSKENRAHSKGMRTLHSGTTSHPVWLACSATTIYVQLLGVRPARAGVSMRKYQEVGRVTTF